MKLHLPTRLRAAVMACLAAVASLSPTVATGVISGGALMFALAGQQAEAAALVNRTFGYTSGSQTYTFSGGLLVTCNVANATNVTAGGENHILSGVEHITVTINGQDFQMSEQTALLNSTGKTDSSTPFLIWKDFSSAHAYYGQTMCVTGAEEGERWEIIPNFGPITFGGVISEGAGSYSLGRNSSAMELWGNESANLLINAETTLVCNALAVKTNGAWTVNDSLAIGSTTTVNANVAITLAGTGTTSLTGLSMAAGSSLTIGAGSALTLGGTLNLLGTVTNSGTLTLSNSVVFNLSGLTATQNGDGSYSYSLFTNTDGGSIAGLDAVTSENITGITAIGKEWSFDAQTGVLSYTLAGHELTFSGGTLTWDKTSNGWDGNLTFEDGDVVTFQDADANVSLDEDVTASVVNIAEDCTVTLSGNHTLSIAGELSLAGGLVIGEGVTISPAEAASVVMKDGSTLELQTTTSGLSLITAESGINTTATVILNAGNNSHFALGNGMPSNLSGSYPNVYTKIVVRTGALFITSRDNRYRNDITVEDGAGLWIGCSGVYIMENSESDPDILTLNGHGGWTTHYNNTAEGALMVGDVGSEGSLAVTPTIAYQIALGSDSSIQVCEGSTLTCSNTVSGDYDLAKVGSGTLVLNGAVDVGSLTLEEGTLTLAGNVSAGAVTINGGTLRYGSADSQISTLNAGQIVVNSGGELLMNHGGAANTGTSVVLNGGKIYLYDGDNGGAVAAFGELAIQADSLLQHAYNGSYSFTSLTGSGDLDYAADGGAYEGVSLSFGLVKDYTGSVDLIEDTNLSIHVGTIDMAAGLSGSIAGTVYSDNFLKTGEGSFTLGGLSASGLLNMNYEGSLTLSNGLQVADGTILSYSGTADNVLKLDSVDDTVSSLRVDVYALSAEQLEAGVNLGIASSIDKDLLMIMGLNASSYQLTSQDGYWYLTATDAAYTDWDRNWGSAVLAAAPESLPVVSNIADVAETLNDERVLALYDKEDYDFDTYTAVKLEGAGDASVLVVGGASAESTSAGTAPEARNSWILASAGSYKAIIGGNYANNWNSGTESTLMNFEGDSHILIDGATVGTIIGGNYKDGYAGSGDHQGPSFTGDTYISVMSGEVTGSIMGAGLVTHDARTVQTGNTYIYLYTVLSSSSTALHSEPNDMVTGGFMWGGNSSRGQTLNGDTHITLDLTEYAGNASFAKHLIGGNTNSGSSNFTQTLNGGTSVSVNLGADGSMTSGCKVIGGSWTQGGSSVHNGLTCVNLSGGGTYNGLITGGTYLSSTGHSTISGSSSVTVDGSMTINANVVGGSYLRGNGTVTLAGGVSLHVGGGASINGTLVGGSFHESQGTSTTGDISVVLEDAAVSENLVAGSYLTTDAGTLAVGDISLVVSGGSVGNTVIGGSYIDGTGSAALSSSTGDITVTISGGTVNDVSGGTHTRRNNGNATDITQGDITVNLLGGTINGNVYAAGEQRGSTGIVTKSTTVNVGSEVTLANGSSINGGYAIGNDNDGSVTNNSSVTGDRKLVFTDSEDYAHVDGVSFCNFDVVEVVDGGRVTLSGIAANHAATDTLAFTKTGEGTLTLNGASQSGVTVQQGTLALGSAANTLTEVTVNSGATLDATGGTALGGSLTLDAGASLALSGSNASVLNLGNNALAWNGAITLNLTTAWDGTSQLALINGIEGDITGISFDDEGYADASLYMTGVTGKLTYSNGTLYLTTGADNLYWEATGDGNWSSDVWSSTDVDPGQGSLAYTDKANVYFTNTTTGTQTVTIDSAVAVSNMTVGKGSYAFALDAGASLSINGSLSVTDGGVASFGFDLSPAGGVSVAGESSSLSVTGNATFTSLSNTGTVTVSNSLTLSQATAAGGTVEAGSLTVTGSGDNTFNQLTVTGQAALNGALTVGGTSSIGTLTGVTTLTVANGGNLSLTDAAATTSVGSLAGGSGASADTTSLSVAGNLTLTSGESQVDSMDVSVSNTLGLSDSASLVIADGGSVSAQNMTATGAAVSMTGGTLELTSNADLTAVSSVSGGTLKAESASWTITGATVGGSASGSVSIETSGNNTITLDNTTLISTIDTSNGSLVLTGNQTLAGTGFQTTESGESYHNANGALADNGYKTVDVIYTLATNTANLNVNNVTWSVEGAAAGTSIGYDDTEKTVTLYGVTGSEYYINTGTVTYDASAEFDAAASLVLHGGTLDLQTALTGGLVGENGGGISVTGSGTTLNVADGVTLAGSDLHINGGSVTMTGSGTYALEGAASVSGFSGITMGDTWTGTVTVNGATGDLTNLKNMGHANSTIELTGLSGWLNGGTTITAQVKFMEGDSAALLINNGSSNSVVGFSGALSGLGNLEYQSWAANSGPLEIDFTGDVSQWTGSINNTSSNGSHNLVVQFSGSATDIGVSVEDSSTDNATTVRFGADDATAYTATMNGTLSGVDTVDVKAATNVSFANTVTAGTLTAGAGSSVTFNDAATLNTIAGGNVTIGENGSLALTNGASNVASLTANGGLTLGVAATDTDPATTATLTTGALTLGNSGMTLNGLASSSLLNGTGAMVTADSLTLGTGLTSLNITADVTGLVSGDSITLLALTNGYTDTTDLLLNGHSGGSYTDDSGLYTYTLAWNEDHTALTLSVQTNGVNWVAPGDEGLWEDSSSWQGGVVPGADDTALLGGSGAPGIRVDNDETVGSLTVDNTNDTLPDGQLPVDEYTLTGDGSLSAGGLLQVVNGGLVVDVDTSFDSVKDDAVTDSLIGEGGSLTIGDGDAANGAGSLTVGTEDTSANLVNRGSLTVNSDGTLTVTGDLDSSAGTLVKNDGTLTVGGTLTLADTQTELTNAGPLTAGALQGASTALTNNGSLGLQGDSSLKSLTSGAGSSLTLTMADPDATAAPTLTLTENSSLAGLAGNGSIVAAGKELTLTESTAAEGISLTAKDVVMETDATTGGVTLSGLTTDSITFNGLVPGSDTPALTLTGDLAAASATEGAKVELIIGTDAANLATGTYNLLDADNTLTELVYVSEDYSQSLLREGKKGLLDMTLGTASYEVSDLTGEEMTWHTSRDTTEGGLKLDVTADPAQTSVIEYDDLKGVASIYVDADRTLSLEGSNPVDNIPLAINNLQGEGTLTIEGDGIGQDYVDLTVSELTDGQGGAYTTSFANGTLALSGVTATATAAADDMLTQSIGALKLDGSELVSDTMNLEIGQLEGDADSIISGVIHITGTPAEDAESPAAYIGSYGDGGETTGATVILKSGAEQTLTPGAGLTLSTLAGSAAHLTDASQGKAMTALDAEARSTVDLGTVTAGDTGLTVAQGGAVEGGLSFSMSAATPGVTAISGDNVTYGRGASITITQTEGASLDGTVAMDIDTGRTSGIHLASVGAAADSAAGSVSVTLDGALFRKYYDNARLIGTDVVADRNTHYASDMTGADSHNGKAGASLLDDILVTLNPQADSASYADLSGLMDAVDRRHIGDTEAAAVAGASIATLGSAFSGDVERQLRAIRNRTATMGVDQCQVNEEMPYFNAWVNAEGDYRKMDEDGTAAGYTLSSWGGTVGFDVDITPSFTAGLAVTAMYGDLDSKGPDKAEGDFDTYYVSLFARYVSRSWTHTFVGTAGWLDASLDRTVSYAGGSYKTSGDTEGVGFGLMYEVGYVIPLNEDNTACLQPVFNVAWRHIGVDGYSESGSDAGLRADDQSMDVVTFGLGARLQSAVAENIYNRSALFEARALLKVDAGDRQSDLNVGLLHGANTANIESAEIGAVGVELGAGLTIPVGSEGGALFIDGSAELRDGYTNLNGTVGYRINF